MVDLVRGRTPYAYYSPHNFPIRPHLAPPRKGSFPFLTTGCIHPRFTFASMNGVLYLFSIWLLLLTGLPCPDAECHAHTDKLAQSSDAHSDDDHKHKAPCSPFCHCATCPGFSIPRPFSYACPSQLSAPISSQRVFSYDASSQTMVVLAVWQPPQ
ncbi:DUF6660 family protein [Spirosoma radiotolerans]|uniref:DUF6660 family protein n=1 Tax=Spirosoma radiotolerans TaxID=1379870 RepID=UPI000A5F9378|nr:DUF6660 family protein [Spirosoma radiotolerans]